MYFAVEINRLIANCKKHYKEGEIPENVLPLGVRHNGKIGKYFTKIQFIGAEKVIPLSEWKTGNILVVVAKYKENIPDYVDNKLLKVEVKPY